MALPEPTPANERSAVAVGGAATRLAETMVAPASRGGTSALVLAGLWRLCECVTVALIGTVLMAYYIVPQLGWGSAYLFTIACLSILAVVMLQGVHAYQMDTLRHPLQGLPRLFAGWTIAFLLAFAVLFFLKLDIPVSRVFMGSWYLATPLVLVLMRILLARRIRALTRRGSLDRRTAIVGGGEAAEKLLQSLRADGPPDLRIVGIFDDRADERSPQVIGGYPKLGSIEDLLVYARHTRLDLLICALPTSAEERLLQLMRKLWVLPVDIRLATSGQKLRFRPRNYSYIGGLPVFDMLDKPIADWDVVLKWLFDKIAGSALLLLCAPMMLIVAFAVKLDSKGPVLFRQKRYGFNNELIEVFKFRSMYVDQTDATAARLVTRGDPRVTRVGRFIRRTSLDELPQLINVVFGGKLSIVGPRPHAVHAKADDRLYDEVVDGYFARHRVKPGITGWAQVNGWRGETDTQEKIQRRVECDLHYIDNWSIWFDITILAMTPFSLARTENAY